MPRTLRFLLLYAVLPLVACSEPPRDDDAKNVHAVVYQLWVVEGGLEMLHGGGRWIREIHLPEANISFNVDDDRLNCFVTEAGRYAERKLLSSPDTGVEIADPHSARRLGEIEVAPEFVSSLQMLLKQRDEARRAAGKILDAAPPLAR